MIPVTVAALVAAVTLVCGALFGFFIASLMAAIGEDPTDERDHGGRDDDGGLT